MVCGLRHNELGVASHEELGAPFGSRFTIDIEDEAVADTRLESKRRQVDSECNAERCSRSEASRPASFEAAIYAHGLLADHRWAAVLVDEVQLPLMADVGAVPRNRHMDGQREWLRLGSDDRQPAAEHEQFAIAGLGCITKQHVDTESGGRNEIFHTSTIGASREEQAQKLGGRSERGTSPFIRHTGGL